MAGIKVATTELGVDGSENAIWDAAGTTLTLNLVKDKVYTQSDIDNLIANAKQEDSTSKVSKLPTVSVSLNNGTYTGKASAGVLPKQVQRQPLKQRRWQQVHLLVRIRFRYQLTDMEGVKWYKNTVLAIYKRKIWTGKCYCKRGSQPETYGWYSNSW